MNAPWPQTPTQATDSAQDALNRMTTTVAVAGSLATTGRHIDLSGLDATAGFLCAQVLDLPPEQGMEFRSALLALDVHLAQLGDLLRGHAP